MKNPKCWSKIKSRISSYSPDEFLEIIKDLYDLSGQNKTFLESRFLRASLDILKPYKKIIEKALYVITQTSSDTLHFPTVKILTI